MNYICGNISDEGGRLLFAGQDVCALAEKYGTPLYLMDEDRLRANCRAYKSAFEAAFGSNYRILYASKANSFRQIYRIMAEEDMGVDVVSAGEIHTAHSAHFDMEKAYFHSNNKTDADIAFAMDKGVGCFVADNIEEVLAVEAEAARRGMKQKLMLRLTPGIDPHTYEAVNTGMVDSKFGSAIETGQAEEILLRTMALEHIDLCGFHCHVGSMVFAEDVFERAAEVMMEFIADMQRRHGFVTRELDLGGGYGVRYVDTDPYLDIPGKIADVAAALKGCCARLGIEMPMILMEPGRGIVADAGMTLYSVGTVKTIPGYKNYVSIDGGMTDNPRYALYGSAYTCLCANRIGEETALRCDLVGRCCESGDIIQPDIMMPASIGRGDIVAVCTTGAYNYSMASNYNRIPRPPIVMLRDGESYVAVRRETLEDLTMYDI
ncbi:MAG: diaminopimelate decarboxylase [Oscillospiraceae bacterium]|nr:diaminopimelate decarboxylase [Oscillospiraceae bacterium]